MKLPILLFAALLGSAAGIVALDITTLTGTTYRDCSGLRKDGVDLVFKHATGAGRVPCVKLAGDVQSRFFTAEEVKAAEDRAWAATLATDDARRRKTGERFFRNLQTIQERDAAKKRAADDAARKAEATKEERAREERLANCRSGKWERFKATMIGPTPTGQLMRGPGGITVHVMGDFGIAQGEKWSGYFERAGNYDYTAATGGASRVKNYLYRHSAAKDYRVELDEIKTYRKIAENSEPSTVAYRTATGRCKEIVDRMTAEGWE